MSYKKFNVTVIWKITIWEDIEETGILASKHFKGDYDRAVEEADKLFQFYKDMDDVFTVSHFTIE